MNIIYYNPDEMRANVLGCYGHKLVKTTNFDRFAEMAVRFDQCHVQHTVCTPSRCSFMTGWYPHTNGHRSLWHLLRPHEPNTLRYLKQNGYDTYWIGKNDLLATESIPDSVTQLHPSSGGAGSDYIHDKDEPGFMSFLRGPMTGHAIDYHQMEDAVEFLKSRKADNPFMLFIATTLPHCPYTAPEPWYSMYDPDEIPPLLQSEIENKPAFHKWIREYRRLDEMDNCEIRKIMAVYLGMVSYVDHMFGMLLDAMDETGLWNNTSLFFFSDHGDWAGDFNLVEKWPSGLDDCLTRVPMIVYTPGCKAGHVVEEPIECFDIMPTTLELAGIEAEHSHHARSMIPQLNGASGDENRAVFAEGGYNQPHDQQCFEGNPEDGLQKNPESIYYPKATQQQEQPHTVCRATMIRTMTHKLIRRPDDMDELYDLVKDPNEEQNIYDNSEYGKIQKDLTEQMLEWYIQTADITPFDRDPRGFMEKYTM